MAPLMTDDVPALIDANAAKDTDTHAVDTYTQIQIQVQRACLQIDKYAKSI